MDFLYSACESHPHSGRQQSPNHWGKYFCRMAKFCFLYPYCAIMLWLTACTFPDFMNCWTARSLQSSNNFHSALKCRFACTSPVKHRIPRWTGQDGHPSSRTFQKNISFMFIFAVDKAPVRAVKYVNECGSGSGFFLPRGFACTSIQRSMHE